MRTRHSTGGVRKQRGRWIGMWYEGGVKKSKVVGFIKDMTKGEGAGGGREDRRGGTRHERNEPGSEVRGIRRERLFSVLQPEVEGLDAGKQREQDDGSSGCGVQGSGACRFPAR